jgi:hypothetical protein
MPRTTKRAYARSSPATRYLFSNNHVLNPSNTDNRGATIQPGGADGGTVPQDRIGRLYRYVRLSPSGTNLIDTALSLPTRNSLLSPRYATVGAIPGHVTAYRVGESFKKVGRYDRAGQWYGGVVYTDLQINYGGSLGLLTFQDQTVVRGTNPVSLPGDSGSVWLRQSDNYAAAFQLCRYGRWSSIHCVPGAVVHAGVQHTGSPPQRGRQGTHGRYGLFPKFLYKAAHQ